MRQGFWDSIAQGAVFDQMTHVGGRRKPNTGAASQTVLKADRAQLVKAEVIVRVFNDAFAEGLSGDPVGVHARLARHWGSADPSRRLPNAASVAAVIGAWQEMQHRWEQMPEEGSFALRWLG